MLFPVPTCFGYFIDRHGSVYSVLSKPKSTQPSPPVRLATFDSEGYKALKLLVDGHMRKKYVHGLLLETFVGPRPKGHQGRHLDGNRSNNALDNLAWGTPRQNQMDRVATGTSNRGEQHPNRKLTLDAVREIRAAAGRGETYQSLGRRYGVAASTIGHVVQGTTWAWAKEVLDLDIPSPEDAAHV